nr:methyltransferase, TrmH family [Candidatus Cloacimonadota bacterium]
MNKNQPLSKAKISELAKLKQKKYRQERGQVVVEGYRLIKQLAAYGINPHEIYFQNELPEFCPSSLSIELSPAAMARICESDHPSELAALYDIPLPRKLDYHTALYLDRIADPGNMGTIFRTAAAFAIEQIFISEGSCEIANPKVIRSSMGAVYKVPHMIMDLEALSYEKSTKVVLDMAGEISLPEYRKQDKATIYILGSEAHGVDQHLLALADIRLRIPMVGEMESLNVAMCSAILAYHLSTIID